MPTSASTDGEGTDNPADDRQRLSRRAREFALSILLVLLVVVAAVEVMPQSAIKRSISTVTKPIAQFAGLEQGWGVFAPNAPDKDVRVIAYVTMPDGEQRVWTRHDAQPPAEWFSINRWFSFEREVADQSELRAAFADWVVRQVTKRNERPVHIRIIYEWDEIPPPGSHDLVTKSKLLYDRQFSGDK